MRSLTHSGSPSPIPSYDDRIASGGGAGGGYSSNRPSLSGLPVNLGLPGSGVRVGQVPSGVGVGGAGVGSARLSSSSVGSASHISSQGVVGAAKSMPSGPRRNAACGSAGSIGGGLLASGASRRLLTDSSIFHLILTLREAGRRLALSDPTIATAATLFHRSLRVLTTGEDPIPSATVATTLESIATNGEQNCSDESGIPCAISLDVGAKPVEGPVSMAAIDQALRNSLGDIDPHVSHLVSSMCIQILFRLHDSL
ncbi:unnamed protein product [Protopolystoma xenopodis]|uniref:Uncharacterized protein n=1 Tax=Protopolystoma xenopodis TaxID=117903 RepID=A0A3S4ZMX6_9PLAT|nr:unnamed protein product [Protopolystoma xenopodis]